MPAPIEPQNLDAQPSIEGLGAVDAALWRLKHLR